MSLENNHFISETTVQKPAKTKSNMMKLPNLLRILGAAALIIAMISFLAKGWQSGNDLFRYFLMLGNTGVLAILGIASGRWLKESKGARLLLTLALVSVPANFAILGAFIFSQTTTVDISQYPHYVAWTVDSLNTAILTSGGAMLILIPITLFGFTVLARSMSTKLSLLFLFSNAALLFPLRDPNLIGLLVLGLTTFTLIFSHKATDKHTAAKTLEGITALGLQLLPLAILMVRSLWLYSIDLFLMAVLSATLFLMLRQISIYLARSSKLQNALDLFSIVPAILVMLWLSALLFDNYFFPEALIIPLTTFISAAMVYEVSCRNYKHAAFFRNTAMAELIFCMLSNLLIFNSLLAAIACIITGAGLLTYGFKHQQKKIFITGTTLVVTGMSQQLYQLVNNFDLSGWASLAILGIAAILLASFMESQNSQFKSQVIRWKNKYQQWER